MSAFDDALATTQTVNATKALISLLGFQVAKISRGARRTAPQPYAQKYAWHTNANLINRINEHLGVDPDVSEAGFLDAPNRTLRELHGQN